MGTKVCSVSKLEKAVSEFYSAKGYKDGIMSRCKTCHYEMCRRSTEKNIAQVVEKRKVYRQRNRERLCAYAKQRRDSLVGEELDRFRQLRQDAKRRHRARKIGNGGSHTQAQWEELVKQSGGKCVCCLQEKRLTRDHIIPLTAGGTDDISNIQPLCQSCNSVKRNRNAMDFRFGIDVGAIVKMKDKTCPVCSVIFQARNPKTKYCSKKCGSRAASQRNWQKVLAGRK